MKCNVVQSYALIGVCVFLVTTPAMFAQTTLAPARRQGDALGQPPSVTVVSPTNGASIGSADLTIQAEADDTDGAINRVVFYVNGAPQGAVTNAPFTFVYSNVVPALYTLLAVAIDTAGLMGTSAPVVVTVPPRLIPSGAAWKYLDDGSNPGSSWINASFNDAGWSNGIAQLGFGDGDEATRVRQYLANTNLQITTYYFRRAFNVPSTAGISNLVLRLIRDDGAVVYLNGTEVFRINMPAGTIRSTNFASAVVGSDNSFHAARVNPSLLVVGNNLLAVEMHQANSTSSDLSFDLELRPNVLPLPPSVAVVSPADHSTYYGPTNVTMAAQAADFDDIIVSVGFFLNGVLRGTDTTDAYDVEGQNYSMMASNLEAGDYVLRAVAAAGGGLITTSAPVAFSIAYAPVITTLITTGAVWKYLDTGVDQGTAWRGAAFNDSAWPSGLAKFGTNDPAATIIHITPINQNLTAYFRHPFTVSGAASYTNLAFRCLRDDGVVAWLNGVEVFRNNMPAGTIEFGTPALTAIGGTNENYYVPINTDAHALLNGQNVLAVELHQTLNTSDAGFDLGLVGIALPAALATAINIQLAPPNLILSWLGTGYTLQESTSLTGTYTTRGSGTNYFSFPAPSSTRFFRLIKP